MGWGAVGRGGPQAQTRDPHADRARRLPGMPLGFRIGCAPGTQPAIPGLLGGGGGMAESGARNKRLEIGKKPRVLGTSPA